MTFNNSIRSNSRSSVSLSEQSSSTDAVSSADGIQAVEMTGATMSTQTASSDSQSARSSRALVGICRCNFNFFNSESEKFTVRLNDILANPKIETEEYLVALQQINDQTSSLLEEIVTTVKNLEFQLIQEAASQEKEIGIDIVSRIKAVGETLQTALLQCQEHMQERVSQEQAFTDIVNNISTHKLMAEGFSSALAHVSYGLNRLLEKSESLSAQEKEKWKELAKEEKELYREIKTYMKAMADEIYTVEAQIKIAIGDNATRVRRQLVNIYNNIHDTLKRADKNRLPDLPPAEHAAYLKERYQYYMEQHSSLMQRAKNLEENLLSLAYNGLINEAERSAKLSLLRGERALISREARRIRKKLPELMKKMEAGQEHENLMRISVSLKQIDEDVRIILPDQEVTEELKLEDHALPEDYELKGMLTQSEKLKFEDLTSPEYSEFREIPSGKPTPAPTDTSKKLRFNPDVEVTLYTKYIGLEDEESGSPTSHEDDYIEDASSIPHENDCTEDASDITHEDDYIEDVSSMGMSGVSLSDDIANLEDFSDEE